MKAEINSMEYKNGGRVVVQTVTYSKSDDIFTLAKLHNQRAQYVRRIEQLEAAKTEEKDYSEQIKAVSAELALVEAEITLYEEYVRGYGGENA